MNEPIYCALAFGSISIDMEGKLRPCCGIVSSNWKPELNYNKSIREKINNDNLLKLRDNLMKGIWHPACYNCRDTEQIGVKSMRQIWNEVIPDRPMSQFLNPESVKFLDVTLGNKCNSKCMTCNPISSDYWSSEYRFIKNIYVLDNFYTFTNKTSYELIQTFKNVEHINFIGGEPIIIDDHVEFLKLLIENKLSSKIQIGYVTNLTGISDELVSIWHNFKNVSLSVSIDGYGPINDYIRYPIKFDKIEQNLKLYLNLMSQEKFGMTLSTTVSIFNILEFSELLEYIVDLISRHPIPWLKSKTAVYLNKVSTPPYFNSSILSVKFRQKGIEKINSLKLKIQKLDLHPSYLNSCDLILAWMNEPQVYNFKLINDALTFISRSDTYRQRSIQNYLPEVWEELINLEKTCNG